MSSYMILKKKVDMSVLNEGMSIPVEFHDLFFDKLGLCLNHGEKANIIIHYNGENYDVILSNLGFDRAKYYNRSEILQIRYRPSSPIAVKLREVFSSTNTLVTAYKATRVDNKYLKISDDKQEYVVLYATGIKGELYMECITADEYNEASEEIHATSELDFETMTDDTASIIHKPGIVKMRKLDRAIGDKLKLVYKYRCQICGQYIGEKYGSNLIHAHHIDYFTKSLNNNISNILIVCPNHHGIIHDRQPKFDRTDKTFEYPNGYKEKLILNYHL